MVLGGGDPYLIAWVGAQPMGPMPAHTRVYLTVGGNTLVYLMVGPIS